MQPTKTFAAWYVESDWPEWQAFCSDLPPTYADWRAAADQQLPFFRAQGLNVEPATIRPAAFKAWADENGRGYGNTDRASYAVMIGVNGVGSAIRDA